jgi:hypothetical protein
MSSAGRNAGITLGRGKHAARNPRAASRLITAPLRSTPPAYAGTASLREPRGKVSNPGSPLFSNHIVGGGPRRQGFAHAGNAALDRSGPPLLIIPL